MTKEYTIYQDSDGSIVKVLAALETDVQKITQTGQSYVEGAYMPDSFKIVDGKAVEKEQTNDELIAKVTNSRNLILSATDWTQIADVSLSDSKKAEWKTYRQALRDLSTHAKLPNLESSDWPTPPS